MSSKCRECGESLPKDRKGYEQFCNKCSKTLEDTIKEELRQLSLWGYFVNSFKNKEQYDEMKDRCLSSFASPLTKAVKKWILSKRPENKGAKDFVKTTRLRMLSTGFNSALDKWSQEMCLYER